MTTPVEVPPVRARTGQISTPPAVGDAIIGLALLVLPLLGLLGYMTGLPTTPSVLVLLAFVLVYAATVVIAVRGFLSDLTPWRVTHGVIPLRALGAGIAYSFLLAWGAVFAALPNAPAAKAAVTGRIAEFESRTSSAASSASEAGKAAPSPTAVPEATLWDNFLATGTQHSIGYVLVAIAMLIFGYLVYLYVTARAVQRREFPPAGPFDIAEHEIGDGGKADEEPKGHDDATLDDPTLNDDASN